MIVPRHPPPPFQAASPAKPPRSKPIMHLRMWNICPLGRRSGSECRLKEVRLFESRSAMTVLRDAFQMFIVLRGAGTRTLPGEFLVRRSLFHFSQTRIRASNAHP